MQRNRSFPLLFIVITVVIVFIFVILLNSFQRSSPKEVVEAFYQYEQKSDFGSSWELFHSSMKKKFPKNSYVTERSHIYMGHFEVSTFSYNIKESEEVSSFKMTKEGPTFHDVYKVPVELEFPSKFGLFTIKQDVYVVKEDQKWKIVWEFK